MKKRIRFDKLLIAGKFVMVVFITMILSCNQNKTKENHPSDEDKSKKDIYYCPMHPEVQQDHPGRCPRPECDGMELVKKFSEDLLHSVLKPVNSSVISKIKTIHPENKSIDILVQSQGFVDYDPRNNHNISSLYNGRIEKLYIKYNFQQVDKGQPLFDVYSPELITAQENLIYLLNTDANAVNLIQAAEQKLKILGFTIIQLKDLKEKKKVQTLVTVYSNWEGHVHETMNNADVNTTQKSTELKLKEGMYISSGETIFNIVNPHDVLIILQIKARDYGKIKVGQEVNYSIDEAAGMQMKGAVSFIEPFLNTGAKTINIRVDLDNNEHNHKVGSLVKAVIFTGSKEAIWLPAKSILDLGNNKIVWLKKGNSFISLKIETGSRTEDLIEITDGLKITDEIAEDASYLSDSEDFIKISEDE